MFEVFQIKLGNSLEDSRLIITCLKSLDRATFETVVKHMMSSTTPTKFATFTLDQIQQLSLIDQSSSFAPVLVDNPTTQGSNLVTQDPAPDPVSQGQDGSVGLVSS